MSKEIAIRFIEEVRENKRAVELLKSKGTLTDKEELAKLLAEMAAESGKEISEEDFAEALKEIDAAVRQKTDAAAADLEVLADEDLKNVAGGGCDWLWFCSQDWMSIQTVG